MQAFAQAIRSGGQPPIPYDQLIGVTQATFAAIQSLRTGQPEMVIPSTETPPAENKFKE